MDGVRRQISLLLDHGHQSALSYPVQMVFAEAQIVVSRMNAQMASEASLLQLAISTIPNMSIKAAATKRAVKAFKDQLEALTDGAS